MYKVGADLPAGNYVIESAGAAYVSVNTGPAGNGEIVWNDNFHGTKSANLTHPAPRAQQCFDFAGSRYWEQRSPSGSDGR